MSAPATATCRTVPAISGRPPRSIVRRDQVSPSPSKSQVVDRRHRRRVRGVAEGLQHGVRPRAGRRRGVVGQRVAVETHDLRGMEQQRGAARCGEFVERRLAAPGAQGGAGQSRRPELPARHDVQERERTGFQPLVVERICQGGGVAFARADDAPAVEPAQHQGALHSLAQAEPAPKSISLSPTSTAIGRRLAMRLAGSRRQAPQALLNQTSARPHSCKPVSPHVVDKLRLSGPCGFKFRKPMQRILRYVRY